MMPSPSIRSAFGESPSRSMGGRTAVDEVTRRQEDWEKEIETLDQKEMELHQSQLRLIREQTAIFVRDLAILQGEVSALKDHMGSGLPSNILPLQTDVKEQKAKLVAQEQSSASMQKRLDYMERLLGEAVDRQSQEIEAAKSAQARLAGEAQSREAHHANMHTRLIACESQAGHHSLQERVDFLEKLLGESADKHSQGLQAAHSNMERLHGSFQEQMASRMEQFHGSIQERLANLEQQCGTFASHAQELQHVKSQVDHAHQKLGNQQSSLQHHSTLAERVDYLEKLMGDSADHHSSEIGQAHAKLEHLRGRLSAVEAMGTTLESLKQNHAVLASEKAKRDAHHASMAERLDYIEKMLGDSAGKHGQELQAAHSKLEHLHGRLAAFEKSHGTLTEQQRAKEVTLADQNAALHAHHATLRERVDYLESALGDSSDKHARELEGLKAAHSRLQTESKAKDAHHSSVGERLGYLERLIGDSADKHAKELAAAHDKIAQMHSRLAVCEASGPTLDNLKKSHASLAAEKSTQDAHHATLAERVEFLERSFGDSANNHAKQIKAAHDKLEHMHARVSNCEKAGSTLADLHKSHHSVAQDHQEKLQTLHASVNERLVYLERLMGESADKHGRELEALKASHSRMSTETKARDAHHATVSERLDYIEKTLGDSADKHEQELKAAHSKIDQVHHRVSSNLHEETMRALLQGEKEARQKHVSTMEERLERLERMMGETHDKHWREIEATKLAHQRLSKEQKGRDEKHATIAERLDYLESKVGDSFEQHAREIKATQNKLEHMHNRVSECEKHGSTVSELHRSHHTSIQEQRAALSSHHASLAERLDFLEKSVGQSADQHAREVEALKSAHSRMSTETKARDAHHSTMAERLEYIEKMMGDSADKHAKELATAHDKINSMHKRLADCEARGSHMDTVKKSHEKLVNDQAARDSHHATLNERVNYLEKMFGDSADHHKKELQAARQAQEQLHSQFHEEKQLRQQAHAHLEGKLSYDREGRIHHATVEERLQKLETVTGEHHEVLSQVRDQLRSEATARTQQCNSISDQIGTERRLRESLEQNVQGHLATERKAREAQENMVKEQFNNEKAARDRFLAHIQELIAREKEARDKQHDHHQELLGRERSANEGRHRDVHEVIQKERSAREQHHSLLHDIVHKEKAARGAIEELLAQEKAERHKHHASTEERVDSVQKTLAIFDSLMRKEIEERTKEYRRLWDAIDTHTHDLSTQVIGEPGGYAPEVPVMDAAPYRRYPSTSLNPVNPLTAPASQSWTSGLQPVVYQQEPAAVVTPSVTPPTVVRQFSPMVQVPWGVQAK
eukprot:CAMPEP_0181520418 /NCGR_PEP_ID=MMETSP1110-20121109/66298_1 /TAXON_ID=174948 /ORGANISM="Symbiodinium sp., Strain CCMP421" /LENGTH=1322 /DNA_ID=CAMNT_0023650903 /DNA_START=50 /DNA_END=4018 /DNA_ORIENTATION=+